MAKCDVCGNDYDKSFQITAAGGRRLEGLVASSHAWATFILRPSQRGRAPFDFAQGRSATTQELTTRTLLIRDHSLDLRRIGVAYHNALPQLTLALLALRRQHMA